MAWLGLYSVLGVGVRKIYTPIKKIQKKKKHQGNLDASIGFIKVHFRWEESYRKGISELSTEAAQPGERKGKSY